MKIGRLILLALAISGIMHGLSATACAAQTPSCAKLQKSVKSYCARSAEAHHRKSRNRKLATRLKQQCSSTANKFERMCATEVCGYIPFQCPEGTICIQESLVGISIVTTLTYPSVEAMKLAGAKFLHLNACEPTFF